MTPCLRITIATGLPNAATITATALALTTRAHDQKAAGMRRFRVEDSGQAPAAVSARLVQRLQSPTAEHVKMLGLDDIYSHRERFAILY